MIRNFSWQSRAVAFAAIALVAVHVSAMAADGEKQLSPAAMKAALAGNTVEGSTSTGIDFKMYMAADGTLKGLSSKGGTDTGKWSIEGETWCRTWSNWQGGKESCSKVFMAGSKVIFRRIDSDRVSKGTIVKGNSTGL